MRKAASQHRQFLAWWLILSCSFAALSASAEAALGRVLCIGVDGHIAVEAVRGNNCADYLGSNSTKDRGAFTQRTQVAPANHCGTCLDVALQITSGPPSASSAIPNPVGIELPPFLVNTLILVPHLNSGSQIPAENDRSTNSPPSFLRDLRSVVLVI